MTWHDTCSWFEAHNTLFIISTIVIVQLVTIVIYLFQHQGLFILECMTFMNILITSLTYSNNICISCTVYMSSIISLYYRLLLILIYKVLNLLINIWEIHYQSLYKWLLRYQQDQSNDLLNTRQREPNKRLVGNWSVRNYRMKKYVQQTCNVHVHV